MQIRDTCVQSTTDIITLRDVPESPKEKSLYDINYSLEEGIL